MISFLSHIEMVNQQLKIWPKVVVRQNSFYIKIVHQSYGLV